MTISTNMFDTMASELVLRICDFLDVKSLKNLRLVCKGRDEPLVRLFEEV